ncbi:hypothetical protein NYR30_08305 [Gallibacterium salpingitidis]|uniref:hypothetical protein n=1 Tax=Gallibacterium salpingitidis TaxID=505341 RepID=UPI00266F1C5D|nr:hypothetical protein [Gallibacterium salpingitidis]WKS98510.1 hypothetical protein NYR30_06865 [Gallibacterium salpingitidis]WKS98768.1 hypothetical protein NYR30_08305 [Gallibacterium salpingitidis]
MKAKCIDLNTHLFLQLERLNDEGLTGDALKEEIERSKAISSIANNIVNNAKLALDAQKFKVDYGVTEPLPSMLENKRELDQEPKKGGVPNGVCRT